MYIYNIYKYTSLLYLLQPNSLGQEVQIEPWAVRAANLRDQECQDVPGTSIGI